MANNTEHSKAHTNNDHGNTRRNTAGDQGG